jgi:hypothetical protein
VYTVYKKLQYAIYEIVSYITLRLSVYYLLANVISYTNIVVAVYCLQYCELYAILPKSTLS